MRINKINKNKIYDFWYFTWIWDFSEKLTLYILNFSFNFSSQLIHYYLYNLIFKIARGSNTC